MRPMIWHAALMLPLMVPTIGGQTKRDQEEFDFVRHQILSGHPQTPASGVVPDEDTATAISYAVALPIYGKKQIDRERPFRADLKNGTWTVIGAPLKGVGGTLVVQIDKATGKILYLGHSM